MSNSQNPQMSQGPWPGRFVWHDFMTTDGAKAQEFYTALFGWEIEVSPMEGHTYRKIQCGPGPIGGIVEEKQIPMSHWMPYVAVEDVDATAEKIKAAGGSVCVPPTDIPQTGRFAVCGDPQGAYFSIYAGLPGVPGFDPDLMVPGRICWNELCTSDEAAAQKFYGEVFGWTFDSMDMGEGRLYHTVKSAGKDTGGMMKLPVPEMPPCWCTYFLVQDLAGMTAKAKELGASAMMESVPIPQIGSFSVLKDPTGAVFSLFMPSATMTSGGCGDCGCH